MEGYGDEASLVLWEHRIATGQMLPIGLVPQRTSVRWIFRPTRLRLLNRLDTKTPKLSSSNRS